MAKVGCIERRQDVLGESVRRDRRLGERKDMLNWESFEEREKSSEGNIQIVLNRERTAEK